MDFCRLACDSPVRIMMDDSQVSSAAFSGASRDQVFTVELLPRSCLSILRPLVQERLANDVVDWCPSRMYSLFSLVHDLLEPDCLREYIRALTLVAEYRLPLHSVDYAETRAFIWRHVQPFIRRNLQLLVGTWFLSHIAGAGSMPQQELRASIVEILEGSGNSLSSADLEASLAMTFHLRDIAKTLPIVDAHCALHLFLHRYARDLPFTRSHKRLFLVRLQDSLGLYL